MNGRFPRTMQEAFGPYTDDRIVELRGHNLWSLVAWVVWVVVCLGVFLWH